MLSMGVVRSSSAAVSYFERDDYYLDGDDTDDGAEPEYEDDSGPGLEASSLEGSGRAPSAGAAIASAGASTKPPRRGVISNPAADPSGTLAPSPEDPSAGMNGTRAPALEASASEGIGRGLSPGPEADPAGAARNRPLKEVTPPSSGAPRGSPAATPEDPSAAMDRTHTSALESPASEGTGPVLSPDKEIASVPNPPGGSHGTSARVPRDRSRATDRSRAPAGDWFGRGARALGLVGAVERADFKKVLEGTLPNGAQIASTRTHGKRHTPGWDLTFSAPKSVSILAEVGADKRLFEAHRIAVHEALNWLQERAVSYRQRTLLQGRRQVLSRSMVAALFQHDTSRFQDPDLHTHAVVANATQRADGRWVAVHSHPLFEPKMAAGVVYRAALAREVQRLGYHITPNYLKGLFEITDVPAPVLEHFAQRRKQIEAWLAARGLTGAEASAKAALATRPSKHNVARSILRREWLKASLDLGFDPRKSVEFSRAAGPRQLLQPLPAKTATAEAIEALAEREAVFPHQQLVRKALTVGLGSTDVAAVEASLEDLAVRRSLQKAQLNESAHWLTPRALKTERRVIRTMLEGRNAVRPMTTKFYVKAALDSPQETNTKPLDTGQRQAARLILTTRDRVVGIVGRPGTGKTTLLKEVRRLAMANGYELIGMAANSEAARTLHNETQIPASTTGTHLANVQGDLTQLGKATGAQRRAIRKRYARQVWIVDEGSQVNNALMGRLVFATDRLGARLVLIGDPSQLPAIEAGKPMSIMLKAGMRRAAMDDIWRQLNPRHKESVKKLGDGLIRKSLQLLARDIRQHTDPKQRLDAIIDQYASLTSDQARTTLVLTARIQDKGKLTAQIRQIRRERDELLGEILQPRLKRVFSVTADRKLAEFYQPKQIVLFRSDAPELGVQAGEYLEVLRTDPTRNLVMLQGGAQTLVWNPREVPMRVAHTELYDIGQSTIAPGETIRWTKNDRALALTNGQPLKVVAVHDNLVSVETDDGRNLTLDLTQMKMQHWDHTYVSTVFSAQGQNLPTGASKCR